MRKYISIIAILLSGLFNATLAQGEWDHLKETSVCVITSGLDHLENPINSLDSISIDEEKLYVYCSWRGIKPKTKYWCKFFDSKGVLVVDSRMTLKPKTTTRTSWSSHELNEFVDRLGKWKTEVYIENELIFSKEFVVFKPAPIIEYVPEEIKTPIKKDTRDTQVY